jgi:nucleoid DNA-binding protein
MIPVLNLGPGGIMAIRGTYKPLTRRADKPLELSARQFARFVSAHTNNKIRVSQVQVLLDVIAEAIVSALAQGYKVKWRGFLAMEMRVLKARKRWDGLKHAYFDTGESYRVHVRTAANLTQSVVDTSEKVLRGYEDAQHPVKNRAIRVEGTHV